MPFPSQKKAPEVESFPTRDQSYTYHFASEYRDRAWSIVPLRGKVPAVPWRELQERRPTPGEIAVWFGENAKEDFNVGIVTGQVSDLVVVDADSTEDAVFWENNRPPTPLVVVTGGGGLHFYYRHPGGEVRNRTRVLGRRLDLRGDGGIATAPPSMHSKTGKLYCWRHSIEHISLDDVPVFDPKWIRGEPSKRPTPKWTNEASDRAVLRVRNYINCITARSGENGHAHTYRATCRLKDAGLSPDQALDELLRWNSTNADPPWSIKELVHKVESVFGCSLVCEKRG